jgi:hypothetical protein
MPWGTIAASVIGGMMSADGASSAAGAQTAATQAAVDEQRRQYDQNRADLAPWRTAGGQAVNKLSAMLGLGSPGGQSRDQIYNNLLMQAQNQYNTSPMMDAMSQGWSPDKVYQSRTDAQGRPLFGGQGTWNNVAPSDGGPGGWTWSAPQSSPINTASLNAQADSIYNNQTNPNDPSYGSLMKHFSIEDFNNDPVTQLGLQFGLDEGTKAINRMANAQGLANSGGTLKDLTKYVTDYIGTKANDSFNRYNTNQTNDYNRLAGVAGTGQTAATQTATLGSNTANNIANLQSGLGNARGAAAIAQGNAYSGAANSIGNWFNQNQMLNQINSGYGGGGDYSGGMLYGQEY